MVADIPGANNEPGSYPSELTVAGGVLYFQADNATAGSQLWKTNGTSSGTTMAQQRQPPRGAARSRST